MEFFQWLENSSFPSWVRESPSVFAFPSVLLLHTIGMSLCVGINAGIDLRILGFAPGIRLSALQKYVPVLWLGFLINAITGSILFMQDATSKVRNPDFYAKMLFIAFALTILRVIQKRVFLARETDEELATTNTKVLAALSLFLWLAAITAGRLLAYVGPVSGIAS